MRTLAILLGVIALPLTIGCNKPPGNSGEDMAPPPDLGGDVSDGAVPTPKGCTPETCFDFYGAKIFFQRWGNPNSNEHLILLNSAIYDDGDEWRFMVPRLAEKYDVIAPDYLGWGRSDHPNVRYSHITQAEMTIALMDYLKIQKAHMSGFSMGGAPALLLGHQPEYQSRVASIVVQSPLGVITPTGQFPKIAWNFFSAMPGCSIDQLNFLIYIMFWHDEFHTQELAKDLFKVHLRAANGDATTGMGHTEMIWDNTGNFAMGLLTPDRYNNFKNANIPVLVLFGDSDFVFTAKEWGDAYKGVPGVNVQILPNCGHLQPFECVGASDDAFITWIDAHPTK